MNLSERLAAIFAEPPQSEAEEKHRAMIRRQIEKMERKLVTVNGNRQFEPEPQGR